MEERTSGFSRSPLVHIPFDTQTSVSPNPCSKNARGDVSDVIFPSPSLDARSLREKASGKRGLIFVVVGALVWLLARGCLISLPKEPSLRASGDLSSTETTPVGLVVERM